VQHRAKRPARAGYVYSDQVRELVHLPDLAVPDHDRLAVGFLAGRYADEERPDPLPKPNSDWAAPRKFERKR